MKLLLENWREYINENKAKPKLRVFDFDDTIAKSDSNIHITTNTGEKIIMDPGEYATHTMNPDYEYDFSEFDEVINPREIVQITNVIRNVLNAEEREPEGREIAIDNGAVDVLFFDDSGKNVDAVQALSDQYPDVKIKARKVRYAKDLADNSGGED
jgi:FMN phosphatase YigB (HAD superfamily)